MRAIASYETRTHRFTRAEYERLIELRIFQPDEEIELIGGQLVVAEPQGAAHYTGDRENREGSGDGVWTRVVRVRTEGPIGLDDDSRPEPDAAVVPGEPDNYNRAHPSRPVLIVEVAEASLAADRQRKGSLYARAGLADYWMLNLVNRVLELYREPGPDTETPFGWRYSRREVLGTSARRWRRRGRTSRFRYSL